MLIAVDMDGVLVDFVAGVIPAIKDLWGIDIREEDLLTTSIANEISEALIREDLVPETPADIYTRLFCPGFFSSLAPIEGAVEALEDLQAKGHTIVIATKAHLLAGHILQEKAEWLARYLSNINYTVMAVNDMEVKRYINAHVIVDDDPRALRNHPTAIPICVSQPWNQDFVENPDIGACIIESMSELPAQVDFIDKLLKEDEALL